VPARSLHHGITSPQHLPIWNSEKRTLLTLLDTPGLPTCCAAALRRELADVEAVLGKAHEEQP
jgi:hypothetical protein